MLAYGGLLHAFLLGKATSKHKIMINDKRTKAEPNQKNTSHASRKYLNDTNYYH